MLNGPVLISLFNHKGGVSKTTTAFNLGWTFAKKGIKTLIVDADPQCNLTAYVLGLQQQEDLQSFYKNKDNDDIYSQIKPIIAGTATQINAIKPCETLCENLFLVAGNLEMSDLDITLSAGLASGKFLPYSKQFIGIIHSIVRKTARNNKCEIILVDMSPSAGALNRSILMGSDYFIVPTSPDFFSYQAIQSLGDMLPNWYKDFEDFRDPSVQNALPIKPPRMLGIISQKYRPYTKRIPKELKDFLTLNPNETEKKKRQGIAKSYQNWIDKIQKASSEVLAKNLKKLNMVIPIELFEKHVTNEKPYNLISISDFNSLVALAQEHQKPVFELTDEELDFTGKVLEEMKKNRTHFNKVFNELSDKIINLIEEDHSLKHNLQKIQPVN